jgi:hypothetical protein
MMVLALVTRDLFWVKARHPGQHRGSAAALH